MASSTGHTEARAGLVIAGRYRLTEPLGRGGMGAVWRAEHLTLRSHVAVKLLDRAIAGSEEMLLRFMQEAQSAAALRGAHVVQIFDYGTENDTPYIVMEMLRGESLGDRLAREKRLHPHGVARIVTHIARAVTRAHESNIVHRDLKPDNVFLVQEDEEYAKVLDFGIAKVADSALGTSSSTRTGAMLGTPYYMSPEQARGNRTVDFRSDLWAIAVIAYECMTGCRPFESDALGALVLKICTEPFVEPSTLAAVPPGFDRWCAQGLAKEPTARFSSAKEMAAVLEALVSGKPVDVALPSVSRGHSASKTLAGGLGAPALVSDGSIAVPLMTPASEGVATRVGGGQDSSADSSSERARLQTDRTLGAYGSSTSTRQSASQSGRVQLWLAMGGLMLTSVAVTSAYFLYRAPAAPVRAESPSVASAELAVNPPAKGAPPESSAAEATVEGSKTLSLATSNALASSDQPKADAGARTPPIVVPVVRSRSPRKAIHRAGVRALTKSARPLTSVAPATSVPATNTAPVPDVTRSPDELFSDRK